MDKSQQFILNVMHHIVHGISIQGKNFDGVEAMRRIYIARFPIPANATQEDIVNIRERRINAMIRGTVTLCAGLGAAGGLIALIPNPALVIAASAAETAASLLLQTVLLARLSAAIALEYGHDIEDDAVMSAVLLTMVGGIGTVRAIVSKAGVRATATLTSRALLRVLGRVPGRVLIEINKRIGIRLLTKLGTRGVINLGRAIPIIGAVAGGVVGGTIDGVFAYHIAKNAKLFFAEQ